MPPAFRCAAQRPVLPLVLVTGLVALLVLLLLVVSVDSLVQLVRHLRVKKVILRTVTSVLMVALKLV